MKLRKNIILITLALISMGMSLPLPGMGQPSEPTANPANLDFVSKTMESVQWMTLSVMFVGATAIVMFVILIIALLKMRHARIMDQINKGTYQPKPKDWKRILMLVGMLILCLTPGIVLVVILQEGLTVGLQVGLVMILVGIGVLVFRFVARQYLPSPSQYENPTTTSK